MSTWEFAGDRKGTDGWQPYNPKQTEALNLAWSHKDAVCELGAGYTVNMKTMKRESSLAENILSKDMSVGRFIVHHTRTRSYLNVPFLHFLSARIHVLLPAYECCTSKRGKKIHNTQTQNNLR